MGGAGHAQVVRCPHTHGQAVRAGDGDLDLGIHVGLGQDLGVCQRDLDLRLTDCWLHYQASQRIQLTAGDQQRANDQAGMGGKGLRVLAHEQADLEFGIMAIEKVAQNLGVI